MKSKILIIVTFLLTLIAGRSWAASARIYIEEFSVKQGEELSLKVMVEADVYVTQAQFYLEIPEGFEFVNKGTERRPVYVSNTANSSGLTCSSNIIGRQLRVFLSDGDQIGTEEKSGDLAVVYLKAKDNAPIGECVLKLTDVVASDENSSRLTTNDSEVKAVVYKECAVSVGVNNSAFGSASVSPVQEIYRTGTNVSASATPSEGYHFVKWSDGVTENPYSFTVVDDVTLTAEFAPNQYTMTFVLGNGEENVVNTQDYGTELTAPEGFAKTGYTFAGWTPEVPATVPATDQTFIAQWTVNQYTITFDTDGGSAIAAITQDYASEVTTPENPTKEGYTFAGWDKEIPATMPAENVTVKAQWTVNQYTITFNTDGGSAIAAITQDYASEVTAPENPTKEGYTFTGWDKEIPATMPAENVTVKAQWTVNQYTITFETDGGSAIAAITQDYASEVTAPENPTKEGYTFAGWDKEIPATMPAENVTVKAQWTVNQYTITFDTDGGSAIAAITQDYASEVTAPENPTKEGYTFTGWDKEIPTTMPAENVTVKAQWTVNQYTITFDTDGGSAIAAITQDYASEVTAPENPTKEGYTFTGWDKGIPATMPAENVTVKAQWTVNQYTITFDTDGGSAIAAITQNYASEVTAPENPTKEGYTFAGWDKEIPATMPAENVTVKAQWTINQYTITFDTDGGSAIAAITQDYASEVTAPENPTKEGYTFKGWDKEIPATMPAENVTITAQFEVNVYAVIYIVDGEEWARDSVAYGMPIVIREYKPNEGYTFKGWTSDDEYETMPAHDVVYTAGITSEITALPAGKSFVDVYTLKGTLVRRRMAVDELSKTLPQGVYIIDGIKIFIR